MSWAPSQSRKSCSAGFHEATEARIGTGPPLARRASRSSTSRTISIVLPEPGGRPRQPQRGQAKAHCDQNGHGAAV